MQASDASSAVKTWTDKGDCNINGSPTLVSVSPASGTVATGAWKTFTCVYSDPNGASDLAMCELLVNTTASNNGGARLMYSRSANKLYMRNNAGVLTAGVTKGAAGTLQSENAILDCAGTTVSTSGNNLTVNWKVQFKSAMAGKNCNLYMQASDASSAVKTWTDKGDVKVNASPTLVSASPASGTVAPGVWKTFTCVYSDPNGASDLSMCELLVNITASNNGGARLMYSRSANKLYMRNNAGVLTAGVTRGAAGTLQSENAILDCAGTTVSWSGNNLTVKWKVQFKSAMAGKNSNLFMQASDALGAVKTWTDKGNCTINLVSIQMINIPAGSFDMGNSGIGADATYASDYPQELPQHSVSLSAYSIGKYEITRGEYKKFINAGGYTNSSYWSAEGWSWKVYNSRTEPESWAASQDWGTGTFTQTDNHPVVGVNYYEAEAFCNWAGGHLPTEAQWERAARWTGTHANVYPWGDVWDAEKCNNHYDHNVAGGGYQRYQTAPVGSYSSYPSPSGCQDMAGNVVEWCKDWYLSNYYSTSPSSDPQGPASGRARVLRGGSWDNYGYIDAYFYRCAYRSNHGYYYPYVYTAYIGFRLAR